MLRLIASDLDGTLLDENGMLPDGAIEMVRLLHEKGIVFCAASGRQYGNLKRLFAPVRRDMAFVCENGTVVALGDQVLSKSLIPKDMCAEIAKDILESGMELLICAPETCYLLQPKRWFTDDMTYRLCNTVTMVSDIAPVMGELNKLSGYHPDMARLMPPLAAKWGSRLHVDLAGESWLDFTLCDKGGGMETLSRALSIPLGDMAAFGDNFNDLSMLKKVGLPFLMRKADERLRFDTVTLCDDVLSSIRGLLLAQHL